MNVKHSALELAAPRYSPEVLREKARDLLPKIGYAGDPYDEAWDFSWAGEYFDWVTEHDKPRPDWRRVFRGQPAMLRFNYRSSPGPMTVRVPARTC